ncbi:MAG TPA: glycoside hydrolase family 16 protein [Niastella sp.]
MKTVAYIFSSMIAFNCMNKPASPVNVSGKYELVWADEFDKGIQPDSSRWSYNVGGHGWGNEECQTYTDQRPENARLEKGLLIIEARRETRNGRNYTSARLVTKGKGEWTYGKVEVKAKLPRGRGTWPAIWMLPVNNTYGRWPKSGEVDIMEHVGFNAGKIHGTIHTEAFNHTAGTQKGKQITMPDVQDAFHLYSIEWTTEKIDFLIDNNIYFSFRNDHTNYSTWPFDQPFYLLLNVAVGGAWGGKHGIDDSIFPQQLLVDYVRVYQKS